MRAPHSPVATIVVALLVAGCGSAAGPSPTTSPTLPAPSAPSAPSAAPSGGASGSGAFAIAGITSNPGIHGPLPSTFQTSFATNTPFDGSVLKLIGLYVSYKLAPGLTGKVSMVTTAPDGTTITDSSDYLASDLSSWFNLAYEDGFALGAHETVLRFQPTGESVTLPFTIIEAVPTPAPPPTPVSTPDVAGFLHVALSEFVPLDFGLPISLDIPGDYAHFDIRNRDGRYIWMHPAEGQAPEFPTDFDLPDSAFFFVGPSLKVGYDADEDHFIGMPESAADLQAAVEGQGVDVRRLERQDLPDFPVLIMEYQGPTGVGTETRTIITTFLATGTGTHTILIQFFFATGAETAVDRAIWERFESSLKQTR